MEEAQIEELISKYLSRKATEAEKQLLDEWYYSLHTNEDFLTSLSNKQKQLYKKKVYDAIQAKIDSVEESKIAASSESKQASGLFGKIFTNQWRLTPVLTITAVFAIIISLSVVIYMYSPEKPVPVAYETIRTPAGHKATVVLPDGSKIYLHAGSSIRFVKKITGATREVFLEGEAFFEVKKDTNRPFIVRSGNFVTTVLGTSFGIKNYRHEPQGHVVVASGKVGVESLQPASANATAKFILQPNDQLVYSQLSKTAIIHKVNVSDLLAWKEGILLLENMSFEQIAKELERWYGVDIEFENEAIKNCQFSASFVPMPVTQVLDALQVTSDFTYTMDGNQIYIEGSACK